MRFLCGRHLSKAVNEHEGCKNIYMSVHFHICDWPNGKGMTCNNRGIFDIEWPDQP